jgi:hypothetical protein
MPGYAEPGQASGARGRIDSEQSSAPTAQCRSVFAQPAPERHSSPAYGCTRILSAGAWRCCPAGVGRLQKCGELEDP